MDIELWAGIKKNSKKKQEVLSESSSNEEYYSEDEDEISEEFYDDIEKTRLAFGDKTKKIFGNLYKDDCSHSNSKKEDLGFGQQHENFQGSQKSIFQHNCKKCQRRDSQFISQAGSNSNRVS